MTALLTALAAGCASTNATSLSSSSNAVGHGQTGTDHSSMAVVGGTCPSTSTDPAIAKLRKGIKQVALPAGFHPVAAVRCTSQMRKVPGDGEWNFADAQRADSGLSDLLGALKLPSMMAPSGAMYSCPAMLMVPQAFALVDANGNVVSPLPPHDVCGFPLPQVTKAIDGLPWRTETDQRTTQGRTQPEIDTGCDGEYKYLFEHPVPGTPEPWSKVRRPGNPQPEAACFYTIEPQYPDDYIAIGSFTHGAKLTAAQQAMAAAALSEAADAPAPACSAKATGFAVLDGPYAGELVELDGCRRTRWPNGFIGATPAALSQFLGSLGRS